MGVMGVKAFALVLLVGCVASANSNSNSIKLSALPNIRSSVKAKGAELQANQLQQTMNHYKRKVAALRDPKEPAGTTELMEVGARVTATATARLEGGEPADISRNPADLVSHPFERFGASSVVRGGKLYQFGGMAHGGAVPSNDLVEFDLNTKTWNTVPTYGVKPLGRFFHSVSLSPDGTTMYVSGGTPCFSRIYMKSLDFEDANGQYITQRQHSTTEELSVEHAQGLDDVHEFSFITKEWTELKAASNNHLIRCKAATNVYYDKSAAAPTARAGASWALLLGAAMLAITR